MLTNLKCLKVEQRERSNVMVNKNSDQIINTVNQKEFDDDDDADGDLQVINVATEEITQPLVPFYDWLEKVTSKEKGKSFFDWLN